MNLVSVDLNLRVRRAVASYWATRKRQSAKQGTSGQRDRGARSAVTGGAQMDGFIKLLTELIEESGIKSKHIFHNAMADLPCFFRPSKKWDLVVVTRGKLVAALIARSLSPKSTDADLDRVTDEVLASSMEFWTAFREGGFGISGKPWLGVILHIPDEAMQPGLLRLVPTHYNARNEFGCSSRTDRARILCEKLLRERHYDGALLMSSVRFSNGSLDFSEPDSDLGIVVFARSLQAVASVHAE